MLRTTKAKAYAILGKLNHVVGRIKAQSFPLRFVTPPSSPGAESGSRRPKASYVPDEETLAGLSNATNTFVALAHNKGEVCASSSFCSSYHISIASLCDP